MSGASIDFSDDVVRAIADGYDTNVSEAPIVVGHPKTDAPAYGWVKGLDFEDGSLFASVDEIDADFSDLVSTGRYKKISASFFTPGSANNPTPGKYYLRHVGFLGAAAPAVKGLRPVEFSDDADTVEFSTSIPIGGWGLHTVAQLFGSIRDWIIERDGKEVADNVVSPFDIDTVSRAAHSADRERDAAESFTDVALSDAPSSADTEIASATNEPVPQEEPETPLSDPEPQPEGEDGMSTEKPGVEPSRAALEKRATELEAREKKIATKEADFAQREAENEAKAFITPLVASGKILPGEEAGAVAFMAGLSKDETADFADGDGKEQSPHDWFKGFLATMPKRVDFAEQSGRTDSDAVNFEDASNVAMAIQDRIRAAAESGKPMTASQAAAAITQGK